MERLKAYLKKHRVVAWMTCLVASPVLVVSVITVAIVGTVILLLAKGVDFLIEKVRRPLTLDEILAGKGGEVMDIRFLGSEEFQNDLARKNLETSIVRFQRYQNSPSTYVRDWAEQELAHDLHIANKNGVKFGG